MPEDDEGLRPSGQISPEERDALKRRSDVIGKRLDEVKSRHAPGPSGHPERGAAYSQAIKLAAELVVGLAFGGAVGWFLDRQFGTMPFLLILFVMLGFAAGLLNVVKGARRAQAAAEPLQRAAKSVADDDDDK
ncbi:MAG: AtpZ/AtpI family protein [Hyphomicrobium sp.]